MLSKLEEAEREVGRSESPTGHGKTRARTLAYTSDSSRKSCRVAVCNDQIIAPTTSARRSDAACSAVEPRKVA